MIFQSNFKQSYRAASQLANRTSTSTRKNDTKKDECMKNRFKEIGKSQNCKFKQFH